MLNIISIVRAHLVIQSLSFIFMLKKCSKFSKQLVHDLIYDFSILIAKVLINFIQHRPLHQGQYKMITAVIGQPKNGFFAIFFFSCVKENALGSVFISFSCGNIWRQLSIYKKYRIPSTIKDLISCYHWLQRHPKLYVIVLL